MTQAKINKFKRKLFEDEIRTFSADAKTPKVSADFFLGTIIAEVSLAMIDAKKFFNNPK